MIEKIDWLKLMKISHDKLNLRPESFWQLTFKEFFALINEGNQFPLSNENIQSLKKLINGEIV